MIDNDSMSVMFMENMFLMINASRRYGWQEQKSRHMKIKYILEPGCKGVAESVM